jgi:hypothetical protein
MSDAVNGPNKKQVEPTGKFSATVALLLLSPTITIHLAALLAGSFLIPLGICHPFDGNGHGSNPLCWIADFGYVFGILASYGTFAIPTLAGIVLLLWHAVRVRRYNQLHPHALIKVHKAARFALVSLVLLSFYLSVCALVILPVYFLSVFVRNRYSRSPIKISYSRTAIVLFFLAIFLHLSTLYWIYLYWNYRFR